MANILVTHGVPAEGFHLLEGHDIVIPAPIAAFSEEELLQLIGHADAVVAGGKLPGNVIRAGQNLKIIANYGAGYDGVDTHTAAACGIPVTNIPDTVTQDTARMEEISCPPTKPFKSFSERATPAGRCKVKLSL